MHETDTPRVVVYQQTHHLPTGSPVSPVSLLPLLESGATHVIIAAIHVNETPGDINLNGDPHSAPKFNTLWEEVKQLQKNGIKVTGMLGGAAQGSFRRLDIGHKQDREDGEDVEGNERRFNAYYTPLRDVIKAHELDGLDLDVEEEMSLSGIIYLIDRLKSDFGDDFIITLAPVATALVGGGNLSGFDYQQLESQRGHKISWYNAQFYNNWGDMSDTQNYESITFAIEPARFVVGLSTNLSNANGYVPFEILTPVLAELRKKYPSFGGVMGWEYYNSLSPGHVNKAPVTEWWRWAEHMSNILNDQYQPQF